MNTTLNLIRSHRPCPEGWEKLLRHLGKTKADDEPLPLRVILESNGLDHALWCLRVAPNCDKEVRLFAVWSARQVQHLMTDPRSLSALDVAERHVDGKATDEELAAAWDAAWDAANPATSDADEYAASEGAWHAAWAAAWAAARDAASEAARHAAWFAARDAAQQEQEKKFIEMFCQEEVTT
jgi:hypothetical protein